MVVTKAVLADNSRNVSNDRGRLSNVLTHLCKLKFDINVVHTQQKENAVMSYFWIYIVASLIHQSHGIFWTNEFLHRTFTAEHFNFTESIKFTAPQCIHEYQSFVTGLFTGELWAQRSKTNSFLLFQ